jgi:ribonuclease-3 family protein
MIPLNEISTSALAYLGDCVLELRVRELLVKRGLSKSGHLNAEALHFVRASAQAEAMERILPLLTEEETRIYKRGRNSGHLNVPKSASQSQYRTATGMEVLFGYLHLSEQVQRIEELFAAAYPQTENE